MKQAKRGRKASARKQSQAQPRLTAEALQARLQALTDVLATSLDIDRVLNELLTSCAQSAGCARGAAYLLEVNGGFSLRARLGYPASAAGRLQDFFGCLEWLRRIVDAGEPVAIAAGEEKIASAPDVLRKVKTKSLLVVPLVLGQDRMGAVVLASARSELPDKLELFSPSVRVQLGHAMALARAIYSSASSEQRFRDLVEGLDAIVWEADPVTFQFSFVSRRAEKILHYPIEQWLTETDFWINHLHPEDRNWAVAYCRKGVAEGTDQEFEYRMVAADGRTVWLRDIVHMVKDDHGRVQLLRGLMVDITDRKRTERKLGERTAYLSALIENTPLAVVVLDADHRAQMCNPAFERLFLYRQSEIVGVNLDELIAPRELATDAGVYTRQVLAGNTVHATTRRRRKDGRLLEVEVHGVPLLVEGELIGVYALYRDITERQRAERLQAAVYRIAEQADRCATPADLYQAVHQIIQEVMPARNFYIALYDEKEDLLSFPYFVDEVDVPLPPQKPGRGLTAYVLRTGNSLLCTLDVHEELERAGEVELVGVQSPVWLGVPLRIGEKTIGVMTVQHYSDATAYGEREQHILEYVSSQVAKVIERKRAEEALRRSEANYRSLVDNSPFGIYRATLDGQFLAVNPALVQMLGYASEAEVVQLNLGTDIYCDPAERQQHIETYWHQEHFEGVEARWKKKDGTPITVLLAGRPVRDPQGRVAFVEVMAEDVTEKRVLEQQLRQAQKMEAVGRLAGGIAHDFNNLLMVIGGHCEMLRKRLGGDHPLDRNAAEVQKAAERAAALTQQLLAFSRKQMVQPAVLDLNEVVAGMESMLRRLIGEHIELITTPAPGLGHVKADRGQIEQVILNLALNARDAMPEGGKLILESADTELDEVYVRHHPGARAGSYVMLAVSDSGVGMDKDTQAHIFEPFFTTKETGKGTGLGLATVYGIVKQSEGYIWAYSEPGQGSTFKVYLPRVEEEVEEAGPRVPVAASTRGTETILVVEDEEPLRKLVREFLEASGYHALEAGSGKEALGLAERYEGPIHLLMTDMVMPGMSGRDLAKRLIASRPEIKVLYMSGYTDDAIIHQKGFQPGRLFLQKPFTLDTLARKLREVLQAREPSQSS